MAYPPREPGKLGRLPGQIPVGLRSLTYYVAGSLPKPPSCVPVPPVADWGMLGNATYGDCGVAGLQHCFMADAAVTHLTEPNASDQQAIEYYLNYTGGQDTGVVLSQYLAHVRANGYYGHTVQAYAPVAVHDVPTLQSAVALYDCVYTGIVVTQAMQEAFAHHRTWTTEMLQSPVAGGHCVPIVAFDDHELQVVTWGGVQAVTYSMWHAISSEAWAVITGEFVQGHGDGRGVDLAALTADLDRLAA